MNGRVLCFGVVLVVAAGVPVGVELFELGEPDSFEGPVPLPGFAVDVEDVVVVSEVELLVVVVVVVVGVVGVLL